MEGARCNDKRLVDITQETPVWTKKTLPFPIHVASLSQILAPKISAGQTKNLVGDVVKPTTRAEEELQSRSAEIEKQSNSVAGITGQLMVNGHSVSSSQIYLWQYSPKCALTARCSA